MLITEFKKELAAFLKRSGYSKSALGKELVNDARFIARLDRPGADIKASTIDKFRLFINRWDRTHGA